MATVNAIRIGPADHGRKMTLEEFMEADVEEGYRYELARGVLEVTEVPNDPHGEIVWKLVSTLAIYQQKHSGIIHRAGGAGEYRLWLPVMISGRNPDVAMTLRNTPKDRRGRRPPGLVMEVVSEGSEAHERDYVTKCEEYLAFGIREYWIIDPIARCVTVLVRDGDAWVEHRFREEQQARSTILPGLTTKVSELWVEAEDEDDEDSGDGGQV
jgi:Uma2 family endonuclease